MKEWKWYLTAAYLVWLAAGDWKSRKVSGRALSVGGVAVLGMTCLEYMGGVRGGVEIVLGWIPAGVILLLAWMTHKIGYADGLVLLMVGMLYGYVTTIWILFISIVLLSGVCGILLVLGKVSRNTAMPYLPFVAAAFVLCVK